MIMDKIDYGKEWVLVVDDEKMVSRPIVNMLTRLGFKADTVTSGPDALKALNEQAYTIVLTDIRMPKMTGLQLLTQIQDEGHEVLTVVMTGFYMDFSWVDVVNCGATDFINKPFGIKELDAKMKRVISERNLKKELEKLTIKDPLTGLFNQRYFHRRFKEEVIRAERQRHPLALIFLSLNQLETVSASRDQEKADELLQKIGDLLSTCTRQGVDTCSRFDNNEFAVIAIDSDSEITHIITQRISKSAEKKWPYGVSIGFAQFKPQKRPEEMIAEASQNLDKAKAEQI